MAMGSKNKQKRFKENETFKSDSACTGDMEKAFGSRANGTQYFKNDHPIVLELAVAKVNTLFIWQNKIQT